MTHKRSQTKQQKRKIRGLIIRGSFYDRQRGEIVSTMTRVDVMAKLKEPIEVHLIPDIEKGEVLTNSRGNGSFQKFDV